MSPDARQDALFDDSELPSTATLAGTRGGARVVQPAEPDAELQDVAATLQQRYGDRLHLGTSSWHFPGWAGLVWSRTHASPLLSQQGLAAYARHPLLRCVSLDRAFYRPLEAATYAALAAQVDEGFRFVVKAPALVTDAQQRDAATGAALALNPGFLDPALALSACLLPAVQGLGSKLGALVFQLSPLPAPMLANLPTLITRLEALWQTLAPHRPPGTQLALEVRDPALLCPALTASLKAHGIRLCLGLHDRLPDIEAQRPAQRAMWPGDLVCRWNLQRGQRYAQARDAWAPFDRLQAPDEPTRLALARIIHGTLQGGHRVYVTINNKAEGSAPLSVRELAAALLRLGDGA
jgi:uncharacterized protein YecE (DUF72 family)